MMGVKKKIRNQIAMQSVAVVGVQQSAAKLQTCQTEPGQSGGEPLDPRERIWQVVAAIPGGQVATYGQVARLAGLPERVIQRAQEVLFDLEQNEGGPDVQLSLRGEKRVWAVEEELPSRLHGVDEATVWAILRELYHLDIANTTPVQALVALNDLQSRLGKRE